MSVPKPRGDPRAANRDPSPPELPHNTIPSTAAEAAKAAARQSNEEQLGAIPPNGIIITNAR